MLLIPIVLVKDLAIVVSTSKTKIKLTISKKLDKIKSFLSIQTKQDRIKSST